MAKGRIYSGIDIGTEKICTVIANQSEESGLTNVIGVAVSQSQGLRKSQIVDLDEAIAAITQSVEAAERMAGFNLASCFVSISGTHLASQNSQGVVAVSEPEGEITPQDITRVIDAARAIALPSSREIIHVIPADYSVDAQAGIKDPRGMTGVRLEAAAHVITASSTAIKNTNKCLDEIGIAVQGTVFSGLAASLSVLTETEKELGVVCLDIGAGTTALAVYVEGALVHTAVIPIGARNITNDLAIGMRLSLTSAETIKLYLSDTESQGVPPLAAKPGEVAKFKKDFDALDLVKIGVPETTAAASRRALVEGIIRPRVKEIMTLVSQNLKDAGVLDKIPAGLVITGGGAKTVSILDVAKRTLALPARVGEPQGLSGLVDELDSPAFATATGLIQYALKNGGELAAPASKNSRLTASLKNLPLKDTYHRIIDFFKSLLPG